MTRLVLRSALANIHLLGILIVIPLALSGGIPRWLRWDAGALLCLALLVGVRIGYDARRLKGWASRQNKRRHLFAVEREYFERARKAG